MLKIRDDQLKTLEQHVRAAFHERLVDFVRATLPGVVAGLPEAALRARVEGADAEAVALGMRSQRAIARFVALRLGLAADPAALEALRAEIASNRGDPDTLMHRWLEAAAGRGARPAPQEGAR
jgi:hypothetical protein